MYSDMTLTLKNRPLQLAILALILVACLALFLRYSYSRARSVYFDQQVEMLSAIADIHARGISILLDSYVEKVSLVASRTRLRRLLAQGTAATAANDAREMSQILRDAAAGDDDFSQITIYDTRGRLAASTDGSSAETDSDFVTTGLGDGRFDAPFVRSSFERDELRLEVFFPLRLDTRQIGVMRARLAPRAINRAIRGTYFGESGEVVLGLRLESGETHLIARLGEEGGTTARRAPTKLTPEIAMYQALQRNETVLFDASDRDLSPVVAVTRYLEGPGWGLIAKIDAGEIERALVEIRNDFILAACLLFVPGLGLIFYFNHQLEGSRRRLEEERHHATVERADRRFRSVFTHSPVAMLMVGNDGIIELANEEAERLLEYADGELDGRPVEDLVPSAFRDRHAGWRDGFNRSSQGQAHYTMAANRDLTAQTRHGNLIPVTIGLTPIATEQGPMVVAAITDLTEREAAHERIKAHAEALERSNEELDRFAYVASHDLKAPLQGIAQLANMIEEDVGDALPAESREDLALMQKRVQRLKNLLDSLLQYSRIGRSESEPEPVDVGRLLDDMTDLLPPGGSFSVAHAADMPLLFAPRAALELVFRNLIGNAVKHHDRERGTIEIRAEETADGIVVSVSDDGPGIPAEYSERVFELFQTLRRRDEVEGSGMGLALVRKTLHNLGGDVELLTREGRGATFRLRFPAAPPITERKRA